MLHTVMIISTASGMALFVRELAGDAIAQPHLVGGLLAPITESAERSIGLTLSALTLGDGRAVSLARDNEYKVLCAVFHGRATNGMSSNGTHGSNNGARGGSAKKKSDGYVSGINAPAMALGDFGSVLARGQVDDVEETARAEMGRYASEAILSAFLDAHGEGPGGSQSGLFGGFPTFSAQLRPALLSSAQLLLESLVAHRSGAIQRAVLVVNGGGGGSGGSVLADTCDKGSRNASSSYNGEARGGGSRMETMRLVDPLEIVASLEALSSARAHLAACSPRTRASSEVSHSSALQGEAETRAAEAPAATAGSRAGGTISTSGASAGDLLIDGAHGERLMVRQLVPIYSGSAACATLILVLRQKVDPAAYQPSIDRTATSIALLLAAANDSRLSRT